MYPKMRLNYHALPEGPAMPPPSSLPDSSTAKRSSVDGDRAILLPDDDDFALGWECANPALQIECWGSEAAAQPLQQFY
jgi:hypothetical protein